MTKAKFDMIKFMETLSHGRITIEIVDFPANEDGSKTAYKVTKAAEGGKIVLIVKVDREVFAPADEKAVTALYNICLTDKKLVAKGQKVLDDFIDRRGTYQKLADAENKEIIKNVMKKLKGVKIEALAMVAETLLEDTSGNFTEIVMEEVINYEIN